MGTLTFQATLGGSVNLLGPNTAATVNLTLPSADGTSGQALQTNGSGTLSFATLPVAGGGTGVTTSTGTGNNVLSNSPTLVTPALGTPASGVLTNTTGLPLTTGVTGTLPTANGGTNLTSFTANGVTYASSTSALATGSALTFDGTNFATTGTATATKLIPTGTSVTGNGMYLPAANSVGISTAGTNAVYIDASQNVGVGTSSPASYGKFVSSAADNNNAIAAVGTTNMLRIQGYNTTYAGTLIESVNLAQSANTPLFINGSTLKFAVGGTVSSTIDTTGYIGIGTSAPVTKLNISGSSVVAGELGTLAITGGTTAKRLTFGVDSTSTMYGWIQAVESGVSQRDLVLQSLGGNLLVGTTNATLFAQTTGKGLCYRNSASLDVLTTSDNCIILNRTTTTGSLQEFRYNGTAVGSISYNGSLTLYNQTSDQRLKENIVDASTALTTISQIKVRAFDWIESKRHEEHGVVAQELKDIAPQCVTEGTNHEDGSIDIPWQVDTSPLVPMLIKAIQEQQALITSLTARITALEAA